MNLGIYPGAARSLTVPMAFINDLLSAMPVGGRVGLESGVWVSTTDQTAKSTVYWNPGAGNRVPLLDANHMWRPHVLDSVLSLSLSGWTASKLRDLFAYEHDGKLWIDAGPEWSSDTARSLEVGDYKGRAVNSAAFTGARYGHTVGRYRGLHVATIYTTGSGTTEDSASSRYINNRYNRLTRPVFVTDPTTTWTYTTATYRQANGSSANQINLVDCIGTAEVSVLVNAPSSNTTASVIRVTGIGLDSTSNIVSSNGVAGRNAPAATVIVTKTARFDGIPGLGRHYLAWLEYSNATGTTTWYSGSPYTGQAGMVGRCFG